MSLLTLQNQFSKWLVLEEDGISSEYGDRAAAALSVYLNTYRGQLMACLEESYEAVHSWLGDTAFAAAAASHIDLSPPNSWTLDDYARDFPATLDLLYPDDHEVGELARLELELGLAFVGPDADRPDPADLATIDWDHAVIQLVPTFSLHLATTNASAIWSALARSERPPIATQLPQAAQIAVWREGFISTFRTLDAEESEALEFIRDGVSFGDLCTRFIERHGEARGSELAGTYLGQWLSDGLISRILSDSAG